MPNNAEDARYIQVGKIVQAHGIKGLVKIKLFGDNPALLQEHDIFRDGAGETPIKITLKNAMGKYWLAEIENTPDRNAAEELRGTVLWMDRDHLPPTEEDEYYVEDLVGCKTYDTEGQHIGKIIAVQNFGAGDLLEVKPLEGESYYIPFTKEYAPAVDLDNQRLTIIVPEII